MYHEWGNLKESADLRQQIFDAIDKIENKDSGGIAGEIDNGALIPNIQGLKSAVNQYIDGVFKYSDRVFGQENNI